MNAVDFTGNQALKVSLSILGNHDGMNNTIKNDNSRRDPEYRIPACILSLLIIIFVYFKVWYLLISKIVFSLTKCNTIIPLTYYDNEKTILFVMILKEILDTMPEPLYFTPSDIFQQFLGATIEVNHTDLGKIIGTVLEINNTGDPNTSWIKMQYYKPDNTLAVSYFSPIDLSAPQYYTGPIPPYQPQPRPFPNTPWWWNR